MASNKMIDNLDAEIARLQLARRLLAGETISASGATQSPSQVHGKKAADARRKPSPGQASSAIGARQSMHQR